MDSNSRSQCVQQENKAVIRDLSVKPTQPLPLRGWISNVKPQDAVEQPGSMSKINKQKGYTTRRGTWPRSAHVSGWNCSSGGDRCWLIRPTHFPRCISICLILLPQSRAFEGTALPITKLMQQWSFSYWCKLEPSTDLDLIKHPYHITAAYPTPIQHIPTAPTGADS